MSTNKDCNILNPLKRDGVSQRQRLITALHPSYVSMDERELKDYLLYARKYASLLRYYTPQNDTDGDWVIFIEKDISTLASIIANTNLNETKSLFNTSITEIEALPLAQRWAELSMLFDQMYTLARKVNEWYVNSIPGLKLNTELNKVIGAILSDALINLRSIAHQANQIPTIFVAQPIAVPDAGEFEEIWNLQAAEPDLSIFPNGDPPTEKDLEDLLHRLRKVYKVFHDGMLSIVDKGNEFLEETLTNYPKHAPYMTLFLTFLCILKIARDHLNTITRRHLNFYYRDILGLNPNPAKPDQVHMVFELAKNFDTHKIAEQSPLKAKKDENGANRIFQTDEELIANKTKIATEGLKSIFLDKEFDDDGNYVKLNNIYAAPIANSADGLGEEISEEDGKWLTLGDDTMPYGKVGFAISSPIFLLKEGRRNITLTFNFEKENELDWGSGDSTTNKVAHELKYNLKVYYSGEKEWLPVQIKNVSVDLDQGKEGNIIMNIELDPGLDPFLNYNEKAHKDGFKTEYPVLKIIMDNDGLAADYLCLDTVSPDDITSKNQFEELVPDFIKVLILNFLNSAETWQDIAGVEPQKGPVIDAPGTGPGEANPDLPDYDIGQTTAENILAMRGFLEGSFNDITDLFNIAGLGIDKLKDLFYSFCTANNEANSIGKIKETARPFDPTVDYSPGKFVIHNNEWYKALIDIKGSYPSPDSIKWQWFSKSFPYSYFQQLDLTKLNLKVDVDDMRDLILENDVGTLNPVKPFQPFGPIPKLESKFYIGNHEVFQKTLNCTGLMDLSLDIEWADLPVDQSFTKYYKNYLDDIEVENDDEFKIKVEKLEEGEWVPVSSPTRNLFTNNGDTNDSPTAITPLNFSGIHIDRDLNLEDYSGLEPTALRGFIRFILKRDFLHKYFAPSVTHAVLNSPTEIPNQPYTPTIASIKLSYCSEETIDYKSNFKSDYEDRVEQLFHIEPFGWKEFYPVPNAVSDSEVFVSRKLVPEFKVTEVDTQNNTSIQRDAEGTLYIGLKDLMPEQLLSILIQVAEGSADPQLDTQPVVWSYLSNNHWTDFEARDILSEATNGLLTSGIIKFVMSSAMTEDNTRLPSETFWIKASVANETKAISKAIAVMTQAVKSTFDIQPDNDLNRLSRSLEARTISKFVTRSASVKSVLQPFGSFNGKVAESIEAPDGVVGKEIFRKEYNEFYIRISERLRHKNRGITIWDYERLVLQEFPDVYKVKCINHTRQSGENVCSPEHAPGHVKVIVLPNLRNKNAVDPLRPMVSKNKLEEIKAFLRERVSDFVHLEVRNPDFEQIKVEFKVRFREEFNDKGFYTTQLQKDIVNFLSPWLTDEEEDLPVGGKIHRSSIINFIEETKYVDFLTDFKLHHITVKKDGSLHTETDVEEAIACTSSSVIVSVPAEQHIIGHNIEVKCETE